MKIRKLLPLPRFRNEDEERKFWASHKIVDYVDTSNPVKADLSQLKGNPDPKNTRRARIEVISNKIKSLDQFPDFDKMTYEEEAGWWETHDLSEIYDELEEVEMNVAPGALDVPEELRELSRRLVKSNMEKTRKTRLANRNRPKMRTLLSKKE